MTSPRMKHKLAKPKIKTFPGEDFLSFILMLQKKMNDRKIAETSDAVGHQISADYRSHFEEMRDSSVATKSGRGFQKGRGWRLKPGPF